MNFKDAQYAYDNMTPDYYDEDDCRVYDAMKDNFNQKSFILPLYEQGDENLDDLLVKVASGDNDDIETINKLVSALQSFYQSEFEKYSNDNYSKMYDKLKENDNDY